MKRKRKEKGGKYGRKKRRESTVTIHNNM